MQLTRSVVFNSPGHDIKRHCPWLCPLTTLWKLTRKNPFLLSLKLFVMIPAKKNWRRTGGLESKITGGEPLVWGGRGVKNNSGEESGFTLWKALEKDNYLLKQTLLWKMLTWFYRTCEHLRECGSNFKVQRHFLQKLELLEWRNSWKFL